ncbi:hypothetical protein P154DRAFT_565885 [Amniculicola lignicola CBS 123094]|uniref:Heterokaryon incompatibility domain-containing protein n=1 Tax=Amniculicola lignicola CBS 123094 TaxID=1392246 RepID=A0A6A5W4B9_9PLEO|nr:hypothetical protein P154DRAFT_565885 [Amniculicola lignicola CBS 123094]
MWWMDGWPISVCRTYTGGDQSLFLRRLPLLIGIYFHHSKGIDSMSSYRYDQLPDVKDPKDLYIRLLLLPPGPKTGPISCRVFTTLLSQAPAFDAVSYCWGKGKDTILLRPGGNPDLHIKESNVDVPAETLLQVPASLIPLLYRTRYQGHSCVLWVDSICINQTDDAEKNIQVARMRDIYIRASKTLLWVGPEADSSSEGMEYAAKLAQRMQDEIAVQNGELSKEEAKKKPKVEIRVDHPHLTALLTLLNRPYFSRAWIVQEVVVSRYPHIVCGDNSVPWYLFITAFIYLLQSHNWIWEFHAGGRLNLLVGLLASQQDWTQGLSVKWWRVLGRHRECESMDPKDKVFSFWGIGGLKSFVDLGFQPDYGRSIEEVYTELTARGLAKKQVEILSVLQRCIDSGDADAKAITKLDTLLWVTDWR